MDENEIDDDDDSKGTRLNPWRTRDCREQQLARRGHYCHLLILDREDAEALLVFGGMGVPVERRRGIATTALRRLNP